MPNTVGKWGNSLAVRIPKALAEGLNLTDGVEIDMHVEDGKLIVSPAKPRYQLSKLLAQFKPEHRHGEVDWGAPMGHEEW